MCQMLATQSRENLLGLYKDEIHGSSTGRTMAGKSAGATVVELGITLGLATPGCCLRCRGSQDPQRSASQFPNVFCSEHCEQEFIRTALASLTLEDCIRMHERLGNLLVPAQEPAAARQERMDSYQARDGANRLASPRESWPAVRRKRRRHP